MARDDIGPPSRRGREDPVVVGQVAPRLGNDGHQPGDELVGSEYDPGGPVAPAPLELQEQAPVGLLGEAVVGQRRALHVATQALQGLDIVRRDADGGVEVEEPGGSAAVRKPADLLLPHPPRFGAGPQPERLPAGDRGREEQALGVVVTVGVLSRELALVVQQPPASQERIDPVWRTRARTRSTTVCTSAVVGAGTEWNTASSWS